MIKVPLISIGLLIVCFPIFLGVLLVLGGLFIGISLIFGIIGGPITFIREKRYPCILVIIFLPLIMMVGGIALVLFTLWTMYRPLFIRLLFLYFRTIEFLWNDAFLD